MFKNIVESMSGIEIYGIVALIFFFIAFLGITYWSIKIDKKYLNKMSEMPLDSSKINGDLNHG